jgi:hypothetical protein
VHATRPRSRGRATRAGPGKRDDPVLPAFRVTFGAGALLCLALSGLVTASLFIAERAPTSGQFLGVSLVVSGAFLALGLLLFAVQGRGAALARQARAVEGGQGAALRRHLHVLLAYLTGGGLVLCAILAVMTYAVLARIDQGFAVFG